MPFLPTRTDIQISYEQWLNSEGFTRDRDDEITNNPLETEPFVIDQEFDADYSDELAEPGSDEDEPGSDEDQPGSEDEPDSDEPDLDEADSEDETDSVASEILRDGLALYYMAHSVIESIQYEESDAEYD